MNPRKFAYGIKSFLVDDSIETYQEMYKEACLSTNTDQYTKDIKAVLSSLDEEGEKSFFNILRIVCIDNTNSFLSLLEGSSGIEGQTDNLILSSVNKVNEPINNGTLMSYFDEALNEK